MSAHTATLQERPQHSSPNAAKLWGAVVGLAQAAAPLLFWWLETATVHAIGTVGIAFIYVGFAVADGPPKVIASRAVSRWAS
jgi:hypothetical protein